jgi:phosphohistidine phosphatase
MRRAQLLLSLALVHGQYHMPRAKFDDVTGAPLNDAARSILQRHSATAPAPGAGAAEAFDSLADVVVAAGTWKFVLLECDVDGRRRRVVRALEGLKYHAENYDVTAAPLKALGIHVRVVGGGRMNRDDAAQTISVYGYSKTFGRSPGCNEATAEMVRAALPGYRVDWSDGGY